MMFDVNEIEDKYLDILDGSISIDEFEKWIYNSKWFEENLQDDKYFDLISLNYNSLHAKYEVIKILAGIFDKGKIETLKIIRLLKSIINRDGKEEVSLVKIYDLYYCGYYFFKELGLDIGLFVDMAMQDDDMQEKEFIDSLYPKAKTLANEVLQWIENGDIVLTGKQDPDLNIWLYEDYRMKD